MYRDRPWLTAKDYSRLFGLLMPGCHCAICLTREALVVDHCHASGRVRALLCHRCNMAVGAYESTKRPLKPTHPLYSKVAAYVAEHRDRIASEP